jgi:hypothetical protein
VEFVNLGLISVDVRGLVYKASRFIRRLLSFSIFTQIHRASRNDRIRSKQRVPLFSLLEVIVLLCHLAQFILHILLVIDALALFLPTGQPLDPSSTVISLLALLSLDNRVLLLDTWRCRMDYALVLLRDLLLLLLRLELLLLSRRLLVLRPLVLELKFELLLDQLHLNLLLLHLQLSL